MGVKGADTGISYFQISKLYFLKYTLMIHFFIIKGYFLSI